jgi:PAS domain S-box-containing protein
MFGYTLEEVIGLPVADFIAEESRESALQRIGQHIEGSYELVGKRKDGRKILPPPGLTRSGAARPE